MQEKRLKKNYITSNKIFIEDMQVLNIQIKADDDNIEIQFKPRSGVITTIQTTHKALKRKYKAVVESICPDLCRRIIKDKSFVITNEYSYDSKVITSYDKKKKFYFQIENGLAHITCLQTGAEMFTPLSTIPNTLTFTQKTFDKIKKQKDDNKKKIIPLMVNIKTSDF